jgi:hypothetical protein
MCWAYKHTHPAPCHSMHTSFVPINTQTNDSPTKLKSKHSTNPSQQPPTHQCNNQQPTPPQGCRKPARCSFTTNQTKPNQPNATNQQLTSYNDRDAESPRDALRGRQAHAPAPPPAARTPGLPGIQSEELVTFNMCICIYVCCVEHCGWHVYVCVDGWIDECSAPPPAHTRLHHSVCHPFTSKPLSSHPPPNTHTKPLEKRTPPYTGRGQQHVHDAVVRDALHQLLSLRGKFSLVSFSVCPFPIHDFVRACVCVSSICLSAHWLRRQG